MSDGQGKFCGTCGVRVDGECKLNRDQLAECLIGDDRTHWQPKRKERERPVEFLEAGRNMVDHPPHYTNHPSGIEVIQITEHENFCRGNAIKYILRAGKKGSEIEDLKKASWYINREIERMER